MLSWLVELVLKDGCWFFLKEGDGVVKFGLSRFFELLVGFWGVFGILGLSGWVCLVFRYVVKMFGGMVVLFNVVRKVFLGVDNLSKLVIWVNCWKVLMRLW